MRAEILVVEAVGRKRLRHPRGEQGESMRAKSVRLASREVLSTAPQGTVCGKLSSGQAVRSTAVDGEGDGAEQVLEGPAAGEMQANTAGGLANAGADFEELGAQSFDLSGAPGLG